MEKPLTLTMPMVRIRLKCPDIDSFVEKYHADVNMAGIFVRTRSPLAAGTQVSFDFRLADDSCLFRGSGVVVWARRDETLAPLLDAGMMMSFDELRDGTRQHFEHVLARRRALEEAADTIPTLVRTFSGERPPLPMTTKMTADELEELRTRMREQMLVESDVPPAPPLAPAADLVAAVAAQPEPAGIADAAAPIAGAADGSAEPPLTPLLVPSEPRLHVEAERAELEVQLAADKSFPEATRTVLAKVVRLRPQPAPATDDSASVDTDRVIPLPPFARKLHLVETQPAAQPRLLSLIELSIASWMLLLGLFAVTRLNLVQRMLDWLNGA